MGYCEALTAAHECTCAEAVEATSPNTAISTEDSRLETRSRTPEHHGGCQSLVKPERKSAAAARGRKHTLQPSGRIFGKITIFGPFLSRPDNS